MEPVRPVSVQDVMDMMNSIPHQSLKPGAQAARLEVEARAAKAATLVSNLAEAIIPDIDLTEPVPGYRATHTVNLDGLPPLRPLRPHLD